MTDQRASQCALASPPRVVTERSGVVIWVYVVLAALLMAATLPGRAQGLGLITEPMLRDLGLDRVVYADMCHAADGSPPARGKNAARWGDVGGDKRGASGA